MLHYYYMADDKGGGGGSSWGAFEIILVIVLAVGFLTQFQNGFKSPSATPTTPKKETVAKIETKEPCGLTVARPHSLEKITSFVTLAGKVAGCEWHATETVALYAQLVDSYGRPVSAYTTVPSIRYVRDSAEFSTSIYLNTNPTTSTGFLLLIPTRNTGQQTATYRIPITFSRS